MLSNGDGSKLKTELFLFLEDDWLLKKHISLREIISTFEADVEVASIRFNLTGNPNPNPPLADGFSLNPSIIRRSFISELLRSFSVDLDPEKQFRHSTIVNISNWKYYYFGHPNDPSYVIDIGKKWRRLHRFKKWQHGNSNVSWQQAEHISAMQSLYYYLKYKIYMLYWKFLSTRK